jgi:hypothetical protein
LDSYKIAGARNGRVAFILVLAVAAVIGLMLHGPIPQPADYHAFADQRTILGVPDFWNVVSNLAFLIPGLIGVYEVRRRKLPLRAMYLIFFAGSCLVALGSGFYHLHPDNETLVWDRMPMAVVFMAFFSIIVADRISERAASVMFYPLIVFALLSVAYWHFTGDLRLYAIAQFLPVLLIPLILILLPATTGDTPLIWSVFAVYATAKLFEFADGQIYTALQVISGHTLKHVTAALGIYFFLLAVRRRHPETAR